MAWKKPKWVQNLQSGAQNVANKVEKAVVQPITTSAPVKTVQRAAQNVADKVGDGLREVDKKVIQPVTTSSTVKAIQGAAQRAADATGDVLRGDKSVFGGDMNRKPGPKGESTTSLVDDGSGQQRAARQLEAEMLKQKALSGALARQGAMVDRRIDASAERDLRDGKLKPIVQNAPWENANIPVIDNIRKTLASGGSGVLALPDSPDEEEPITRKQASDKVAGLGDSIDPETLARLRAKLNQAKDKVVETGKTVGAAVRDTLIEGIDSMDVKIFRARFPNAHPTEVEAYRRAYSAGDKKEMERLNTLMESRQKRGSK